MRLSRRRTVTFALAAVLVVLLGFLSLLHIDGQHVASDSTPRAVAKAGGPTGAQPSGTSASKKAAARDIGVTNGNGSEVIRQPAGSGKNGLPGLGGRKVRAKHRLITVAHLPKTASRQGAMVAGFPEQIVPIADPSTVRSSGVSSTASSVQVSMQAVSSKSVDAVLAFYRAKLSALGFGEVVVPAVGGSKAAGFERNGDNLVVTTTKSSSGKTAYSVFGTLHAGV